MSGTSDVPLELLQEYLVEYEVDRAVLVQPIYLGEDNDYVAACAATDPQRLAAVCVVDPRAPEAADRLEYWVTARGCRGLRLRPRLPAEAGIFGHPSTYALWDKARALDVVVQVLAGPEHLTAVAAMANRYPDVAVVVDHLGHPDPAAGPGAPNFQALLALARFPRLYVKLSGYYYFSSDRYPYADSHALVEAVYEQFGAQRLLWGSDFPHVLLQTGYRRSLLLPKRAFSFIGAEDLAHVMGRNAARLFWPEDSA